MPVDDFTVAVSAAGRPSSVAGTVEVHRRHDPAERLLGIELDGETETDVGEPSALTALEAAACIIEDFAFLIDHRAWNHVVAHHVGRKMHEVGIGRRHEHTQTMARPLRNRAVIPPHQRSMGRIPRDRPGGIGRLHKEFHKRSSGLGRQRCREFRPAIHWKRREGIGSIKPPAQHHGGHAIRIGGPHAHGCHLVGERHHGRMLQPGEARTEIGDPAAVDGSRSSRGHGHRQDGLTRQPIEIETAQQTRRATQPARPEADLIRGGIAETHVAAAAFEGSRALIVHVLGRSGGHDAQDGIAGIRGIVDDHGAAMASVIPDEPPCIGTAGEVAILDEFAVSGAHFLHADVINEAFPAIEEAKDQFVELRGVVGAREGSTSPGKTEGLPLTPRSLVTRRPRFRHGIVGIGIAQFEARAAAVGPPVPAATGPVTDAVSHVVGGIFQHNGVAPVGKRPAERPGHGNARKPCQQGRRILRHHKVSSPGQDISRPEIKGNAAAHFPAGKGHRRAAPVVQLHPFLRVLHNPGRLRHGLMMIHDFVDDDLIRYRKLRSAAGIENRRRRPRPIRQPCLRPLLDHLTIEDPLPARAQQEKLVAIQWPESKDAFAERQPGPRRKGSTQPHFLTTRPTQQHTGKINGRPGRIDQIDHEGSSGSATQLVEPQSGHCGGRSHSSDFKRRHEPRIGSPGAGSTQFHGQHIAAGPQHAAIKRNAGTDHRIPDVAQGRGVCPQGAGGQVEAVHFLTVQVEDGSVIDRMLQDGRVRSSLSSRQSEVPAEPTDERIGRQHGAAPRGLGGRFPPDPQSTRIRSRPGIAPCEIHSVLARRKGPRQPERSSK